MLTVLNIGNFMAKWYIMLLSRVLLVLAFVKIFTTYSDPIKAYPALLVLGVANIGLALIELVGNPNANASWTKAGKYAISLLTGLVGATLLLPV